MSAQTLMPVEELMWSWPTVCKAATNDWAKCFALSIAKQSKRRRWHPSEKQHVLMHRLVSELYQDRGDDFDLIEN